MVEFGTYYPQYNVSFTAGDVFRVSVESGVVKYKKNGVVYHTSPGIPTYPLKVDSALYTTNSTLTNAVVGGNWSGGSGGGGSSSSSEVLWLVADHLGTPRMILDQSGSLANIKRHDYLPFGEELFAGTGGRTTGQGYTASDNVRQKFTSKERDNETGLDYFLARYYSNVLGRFTSPDEFKGGPDELWTLGSGDPEKQALVYADITNPQSLNKYQYTLNNPLRYVDPDGRAPQDSFHNRMDHLIRQQLKGEITEKEYRESLRGPAVGAAAAVAIIVAAKGGRPVLTALAMWASRNPDKVQQIAQAFQEAGGGPPQLTLLPSSRLRSAEISTGHQLIKQLGIGLTESAHQGADYVVTGTKITIEAIGTPDAYKNWGRDNGAQFLNQLARHFTDKTGIDYVAVDLRGASKSQVKEIKKVIAGLTEEQRNKVIYVQ